MHPPPENGRGPQPLAGRDPQSRTARTDDKGNRSDRLAQNEIDAITAVFAEAAAEGAAEMRDALFVVADPDSAAALRAARLHAACPIESADLQRRLRAANDAGRSLVFVGAIDHGIRAFATDGVDERRIHTLWLPPRVQSVVGMLGYRCNAGEWDAAEADTAGDIWVDWAEKNAQRAANEPRTNEPPEDLGRTTAARDAEEPQHKRVRARRAAPPRPPQELLPLGSRDPATGRLVLSTAKTLPTAQAYVREHESHPDGATLRHYAGAFVRWRGNRWAEVEEGELAQHLHTLLHDDALHYVRDKKTGDFLLANFDANPGTVRQAIDTLRNDCFLPSSTIVPSWLGSAPPFPLRELLPCATRTLHIPTGQTIEPTPALFTTAALAFDFDPAAPEPARWLAFLRDLFGDDEEQLRLLQEWFGYALTADTRQQKILLVVGPRRSGKGTLARVLTQLVGAANVCGPTVSSLGGPFGLQPLVGKSLAIVSDARFAGESITTVVERLLCISGEDTITVDRKHVASVTLRLPTRFVFLTNELPRLNDASTALAGRFSILRLDRSFYGNEDVGLLDALLAELPGILLWSILGWHRLHEQRRFTDPVSTRTAVQDIEDLSSPVSAFVRERCVIGANERVSCSLLYEAWKNWCLADGRVHCNTAQMFGRDLTAAVSNVTRRKSTGDIGFYVGIGLRG